MRHRIRDSMSSLESTFFFHGVPSQEFRKISFTKNHSSEFRRPNIHWWLLGFGIHLQWNSGGTLWVWNFTSQVWQVIYLKMAIYSEFSH